MRFDSLKLSSYAWLDPIGDIEIHFMNCDSRKEARKKLILFIDRIRKVKSFAEIRIGE